MNYLYLVFSYLLGSIPFGLIAGNIKGVDLRQHGSKNIGATNAFRVLGKKWGISVFILDALKGFVAVSAPSWLTQDSIPLNFKVVLAAAAIVGHTFPVWLKFKGGKGVATSLGVFLTIAFFPALVDFGLWVLVFMITRTISIASLVAALFFPLFVWLLMRHVEGFGALFPVAVALSGFIFYTHRANIGRLIRGEENKII